MRLKTIFAISTETLPLLIAAGITYFFHENSILLTFIYLALIGILLFIKYKPGDLFSLCYGAVLGFAIEVFETNITRIHTFAHADFLGMPMWMPIVWGYGFMLMKRIGIIIYEDAKSAVRRQN